MKKSILLVLICINCMTVLAQRKKKESFLKGMYVQWGYNTEWYTRSSIHFHMSNGNNFILHNATAHDAPDMDAIGKKPVEISIPQYNYRIGFYLNEQKNRAIEINFDHAKYIVTDGQKVKVTGNIDGQQVSGDSILNPSTFLHFEHTDGANWLHINYVQQQALIKTAGTKRNLVTFLWKVGAGINIPRSDFTWRGDELNNNFHVAGYNISAETGFRLYPLSKLFIEGTGKSGFVKYVNALTDTKAQKGNRASHSFGYLELIGTIGYDINL